MVGGALPLWWAGPYPCGGRGLTHVVVNVLALEFEQEEDAGHGDAQNGEQNPQELLICQGDGTV